MKIIQIRRPFVGALFVASLLWQPTVSFGQQRPMDVNQPTTASCCVTPQAISAVRAAASPGPLHPTLAADTPVRMTSLPTLGDEVETARVRAAIPAGPTGYAQPVVKTATVKSAASPLSFTPSYSAYLPLMAYQPGELYGNVTFKGAPAAGVTVTLRFYNGVSNSTIATATTDSSGGYSFVNYPALTGATQEYWIRFDNIDHNTSRLYLWLTHVITTYDRSDHYRFSTFDIADVPLGAPGPGAVIAPPQTFTWTMRTATPSDSYELLMFDPTGMSSSYYGSGLLGYTGANTISSVPTGMSLLALYGWYVGVNSPEGGYGVPYYYSQFRFGKSGIQGRVTQGGVNASGVTVELFMEQNSSVVSKGTTTTGSDGIYQFTSAATLLSGQKYYVQFLNNTQNTTRLIVWYTNYVLTYTAGQRAYAGNFDIADFPPVSPYGDLYSPYTFTWTPRSNVPGDWYFVEVYGASGSPYTYKNALGNAGSLSFGSIPSGFSPGVSYHWDVGVYGGDGGIGYGYYYSLVTFR